MGNIHVTTLKFTSNCYSIVTLLILAHSVRLQNTSATIPLACYLHVTDMHYCTLSVFTYHYLFKFYKRLKCPQTFLIALGIVFSTPNTAILQNGNFSHAKLVCHSCSRTLMPIKCIGIFTMVTSVDRVGIMWLVEYGLTSQLYRSYRGWVQVTTPYNSITITGHQRLQKCLTVAVKLSSHSSSHSGHTAASHACHKVASS